ncbi:TatD family hydrolase [Reichenbachiella versicolor]|uniref:TatD family hydrolase n=1 Tax=Reichenbachiella versicolor TaxID=1821036 RepID=UPI000D6E7819|nr:TatD family hydrolase [Reichenbachiella versicolor]
MNILQKISYLDFHTHRLRHQGEPDTLEVVSLHLGQNKPFEYFTIGIHPWWATPKISIEEVSLLKQNLNNSKCLGMGEIGLDKLKGLDIASQTLALKAQLNIASELGKSVIIHCVRASDQIIKIKKEYPNIEKWCIHGYNRHPTLAKQLIGQGFYLSLMPEMPDSKLSSLLKTIPLDRLFLETDSMANANIKDVYIRAAKMLNTDLFSLSKQINKNAKQFFKL